MHSYNRESTLLITNNPKVASTLEAFPQEACDSYQQVLFKVRDHVHSGARLLTHPLAGSVKPGESPYRSVAVSKEKGQLDMRSLEVIESAIERFDIMTRQREQRQYPQQTLEDFQLIDFNLLLTGLESVVGRVEGVVR